MTGRRCPNGSVRAKRPRIQTLRRSVVGPARAGLRDGRRGIGSGQAVAEGGLDGRAERPEADEPVDDVDVSLAGEGRLKIPAVLAVIAALRIPIAALGCPAAGVAAAGVEPGRVAGEQQDPAIRLRRL